MASKKLFAIVLMYIYYEDNYFNKSFKVSSKFKKKLKTEGELAEKYKILDEDFQQDDYGKAARSIGRAEHVSVRLLKCMGSYG